MHDHKRLPHSILISLGLALALVPACDDGEPSVTDLEFRSDECPADWTLYGEWAGGFCCSGYTDGSSCSGTVCALDPNQTQGNRMCSTYDCPENWELYGEWAGGFCCNGQTDGDTCSGGICALDPNQSQGYPECIAEMGNCPPGKTGLGGMCCNNDGTQCSVPECPVDPEMGQQSGYYVCFSSSLDLPLQPAYTQCLFAPAGTAGLKVTPDEHLQTHTRSVMVTTCGTAAAAKVFVYDGYGQTSDTDVFDGHTVGNLSPWIQNDVRSMWISPTDKHVCLIHQDSSEYRTCVPPSSEVHNLAPDFADQVESIEASPHWIGVGADLWEHSNAGGQWIYVSANEDLDWRPIVTNGEWTRWRYVTSSFKFRWL